MPDIWAFAIAFESAGNVYVSGLYGAEFSSLEYFTAQCHGYTCIIVVSWLTQSNDQLWISVQGVLVHGVTTWFIVLRIYRFASLCPLWKKCFISLFWYWILHSIAGIIYIMYRCKVVYVASKISVQYWIWRLTVISGIAIHHSCSDFSNSFDISECSGYLSTQT